MIDTAVGLVAESERGVLSKDAEPAEALR